VDDPANNNVVQCVYIGQALTGVTDRRTAYHSGDGLNAEHTWPQSKGAEGVAKADLNHLFPANCHANSTRSSYPFGVVKSVQWEEGGSKLGTDAEGHVVFEPRDEHKGNVARAILYFYTVYGQNGGVSLDNFKIEEETLKRWHVQDPVNAADMARNDRVMGAQGNRNPYIDHPEYVGAVGQFLDR
jgi:endonuclease I